MLYLLAAIAIVITADLLRSIIALSRIQKQFYTLHTTKPNRTDQTFGRGEPFHLAILGDSTFDVRADSQTAYGPAQVFVNHLSVRRAVNIHFLAKAGAKTGEVISEQLPKLDKLPRVDLVVVYMGANNVVRFGHPSHIEQDYEILLRATDIQNIPVIASEIANYWHFTVFSWGHRLWLYYSIHSANRRLRTVFANSKKGVLVSVKFMHLELHKQRRRSPYLSDGFHPDDNANITWGEHLLSAGLNDPKTKHILTGIID